MGLSRVLAGHDDVTCSPEVDCRLDMHNMADCQWGGFWLFPVACGSRMILAVRKMCCVHEKLQQMLNMHVSNALIHH